MMVFFFVSGTTYGMSEAAENSAGNEKKFLKERENSFSLRALKLQSVATKILSHTLPLTERSDSTLVHLVNEALDRYQVHYDTCPTPLTSFSNAAGAGGLKMENTCSYSLQPRRCFSRRRHAQSASL